MSKFLLTNTQSALAGALIRGTLQDTDFYQPISYDIRGVQAEGQYQGMKVWAPTSSHLNQKVQVVNPGGLDWHWKTFIASIQRDSVGGNSRGGTVSYTIHASQTGYESGPRYRIGLQEPYTAIPLNSMNPSQTLVSQIYTELRLWAEGPGVIEIEWGWDPARGGFLDVYFFGTIVQSYEQPEPLPAGTVLMIELAENGTWNVWKDTTLISPGRGIPTGTGYGNAVFPLNLRYKYRCIAGGLYNDGKEYLFNEPSLRGAWVARADIFWADQFYGGDFTVGAIPYSANMTQLSIPGWTGAAVGQGLDGAGQPYFEVLMPSSGDYEPVGGGSPLALAGIKLAAKWNRPGVPGGTSDYQQIGWTESSVVAIVAGPPAQQLTLNCTNPLIATPVFSGGAFQPYTLRITSPQYTASQLTFEAIGGAGSFGTGADKNLYTAPTEAGIYWFKVTYANQEVTVTVKVPCVIGPESVSLAGETSQVFKTNFDVVDYATTGWGLDGGTFSNVTKAARSVTYYAPGSTGTFHVTAQANVTGILTGTVSSTVSVTASGPAPATGMRLSPAEGISAGMGTIVNVIMDMDLTAPIWAVLGNMLIDGANNNLKIDKNKDAAWAIVAQGIGWGTSNFKWKFNSTNLASGSDRPYYSWFVVDAIEGVLARITLEYLGSGNDWRISFVASGETVAQEDFTATATTEIEIDSNAGVYPLIGTFRYRASSGDGWTTLGTANLNGAQFYKFYYAPRVYSQADRTVIIAQPTLSGTWPRFYKPTFAVELLDSTGGVIGTLPFTVTEQTQAQPGPWICAVSLNVQGRGLVRCYYPSGITAKNTVALTIGTPTGEDPLVVQFPPSSPWEVDPGETFTVSTNYNDFTNAAAPGNGSFGSLGHEHDYTAPLTSGKYKISVSRSGVTKWIDIYVRAVVEPSSISLPAGNQYTLWVNYTGTDQLVSASAGQVVFGASIPGVRTYFHYTAPSTPGNYEIHYQNPVTTDITIPVAVTAAGVDPIQIQQSDPQTKESGDPLTITTNYNNGVTIELLHYDVDVVIAGAVSGNVVTAPATAGWYRIRATRGGSGSDEIVLKVPLRLKPKNPPPIQPPNTLAFTANFSPVTWSVPTARSGYIDASGVFHGYDWPDVNIPVTVSAYIQGILNTDTTNVTVLATAFKLQNPSTMTVNPGDTVTISPFPPYVVGDCTFASGGFGTWAGHVWTAPADAGTYTLTVTHTASGQTATITVTVRLLISPASWSMQVNTSKVFTVNADVTSWGATPYEGITILPLTGRTASVTPSVAGRYIFKAVTALGEVSATIDATGTAEIPFVITNADPSICESDQTIAITTNPSYPADQLTFSASGGAGSWQGNLWRAPKIAGNYTITVQHGTQSDSIVVQVPVRIIPGSVTLGLGGKVQFTVNHTTFTWNTKASIDPPRPAPGLISADGWFEATQEPGYYPNSITVSTPAGVAYAHVTIEQGELVVYGPTKLTLPPDGTYLVQSNPSGRAVKYTAHGGSFSGPNGNLYTAPHNCGDYWFTVSYGSKEVRIDVHVPLEITPHEVNLAAGGSQTFTANATNVTWGVLAVGGGQPGTISQGGVYQAPSSGGTVVKITAVSGADSDFAYVFFLTAFPYSPTYVVEGETQARSVLVRTEDGSVKGRLKGGVKKGYMLKFERRETDEILAAFGFYSDRFPETPFIFHDQTLDIFVAAYFDSSFKWQAAGPCAFDYSFRIVEV